MTITLPLLTKLITQVGKQPLLGSTLFVCIQHLTTTTVALFKALIEIGAQPTHIVLLGKYYSSSPSAIHDLTQLGIQVKSSTPALERGKFSIHFKNDVHQLWQSAREIIQNGMIKNIIVLDDGGHCLSQIPVDLYAKYPMAGIEQTTAGLSQLNTHQLPLPIILVALSAAKKELESPVIASAIAERVIEKLPPPNTVTCGVVGVGSIGKAMIKRLQLLGYPVLIYDNNMQDIDILQQGIQEKNISSLIKNSDIIFGCTGTDILEKIDLNQLITSNKIFISCSSEDKEFLSLLKQVQRKNKAISQENALSDILYTTENGCKIEILRGGFPVNFNHTCEVEPPNEIQLTRGLLFGGLIQAILYMQEGVNSNTPKKHMLHPVIQQFIALSWNQYRTNSNLYDYMDCFSDINWIIKNSKGVNYNLPLISKIFT